MTCDYICVKPFSELDSGKIFAINPDFLPAPLPQCIEIESPRWDPEFCMKNTNPFSGDFDDLVHRPPLGSTEQCKYKGQQINQEEVLSQPPASSKVLLQHLSL